MALMHPAERYAASTPNFGWMSRSPAYSDPLERMLNRGRNYPGPLARRHFAPYGYYHPYAMSPYYYDDYDYYDGDEFDDFDDCYDMGYGGQPHYTQIFVMPNDRDRRRRMRPSPRPHHRYHHGGFRGGLRGGLFGGVSGFIGGSIGGGMNFGGDGGFWGGRG